MSTDLTLTNHQKRQRWVLLFLALLFIGPFLGAWSLYTTQFFVPETLNRGILLKPVVPLYLLKLKSDNPSQNDLALLKGKWLMLYLLPSGCARGCQNRIYELRQINIATGKNMNRVERVWVTLQSQNKFIIERMKKSNPGLFHFFISPESYREFAQQIVQDELLSEQGNVLLVDPLGNIMMIYRNQQPAKDIFKDLKRLLSQV